MKISTIRLFGILGLLLFVWGCQSDIAFSQLARVGGTVTVSLGGTNFENVNPVTEGANNIDQALIQKEDITATIVSDVVPTPAQDVTIRHLFRVYSDPTSSTSSLRGDGMWMAIIDLADSAGTPVSLAAGQATIRFDSPYFREEHLVTLEILGDAIGSPHPLISQQFAILADKFSLIEPARQALVSTSGVPTGGRKLAAATHVFDIPHVLDSVSNPFATLYAAAPVQFPTKEQVSFHVARLPSSTYSSGTLVSVHLTAPEGLDATELDQFNFIMSSDLPEINLESNSDYWNEYHQDSFYYDEEGTVLALTPIIGSVE